MIARPPKDLLVEIAAVHGMRDPIPLAAFPYGDDFTLVVLLGDENNFVFHGSTPYQSMSF